MSVGRSVVAGGGGEGVHIVATWAAVAESMTPSLNRCRLGDAR